MATVVSDVNALPEKPKAAAAAVSKDGTLGVVQVIPATGPSNHPDPGSGE